MSTALDLLVVVTKIEGFVMQEGETTAAGADDAPLDAWLRHALQQSFKATLCEPLPADLLALAAGQPRSRGLQMAGGNERRLGRSGEVCEGQ